MHVTTATTHQPFHSYASPQQGPTPPPGDPDDSWTPGDTARLAGGVIGGSALGLGLGYIGLELGVRYGMSLVTDSFSGSPPLLQILGILTSVPVAAAYGLIGGSVGAAAGATAGTFLGAAVADKLHKG